jgi:HSP20 family protein
MSGIMAMPLPAPFLDGLRYAMERLADGPLAPALDLIETREAIVAKVALPGPKPRELDITIEDGLVRIRGCVQEAETTNAGYLHMELTHGSFGRSFWLPSAVNVEAATASFKDGLLTLTLPKAEEVSTKRVNVEVV